MSNERQEPDQRDVRYLQFVTGRLHGWSDTEIAEKWGLSPIALYQSLSRDGYPVCPVCGASHVDADHCAPSPEEEKPKTRKARAGNKNAQVRPLPPVGDTADLFRKALNKLAREVDELEHRRESHTGGRFLNTDVYPGSLLISRADVTHELWGEWRERYGEEAFNDAGDRFWFPGAQLKQPGGGDISPAWPLPALIATYLLSGEPLESLLESLHPDPQNTDPKKIHTYIEGRKKPDGRDRLKVVAQQVAALMRGDTRERGTPPVPLTQEEHNVAGSVTDYRKKGLSDAKIAAKFAHRGITERDVRRLGNLDLSWPGD